MEKMLESAALMVRSTSVSGTKRKLRAEGRGCGGDASVTISEQGPPRDSPGTDTTGTVEKARHPPAPHSSTPPAAAAACLPRCCLAAACRACCLAAAACPLLPAVPGTACCLPPCLPSRQGARCRLEIMTSTAGPSGRAAAQQRLGQTWERSAGGAPAAAPAWPSARTAVCAAPAPPSGPS